MYPKILVLSILFLFTSCVKDVDFDQSDDLSIQPKYVASLIHFTFKQDKFIDDIGNIPFTISESSPAPINTSTIANENLTKAEIQFKVSNSFNRTFILVLRFYNTLGQETFAFNPIRVYPNTTNIKDTQIIQGADLNNFRKSHSASIEIILLPSTDGSVINPIIQQLLNVQVSGIFSLNFNS